MSGGRCGKRIRSAYRQGGISSRFKKGAWLFLAMGMLAGCVIGDGFVFFEGKVISEQGEPLQGCELALFLEGDELDFGLARRRVYITSIEPEFKDGFAISPFKKNYYFAVRCPGYATPYKSDIYAFGGGAYFELPGERLDLGMIVMRK